MKNYCFNENLKGYFYMSSLHNTICYKQAIEYSENGVGLYHPYGLGLQD